MYSVLRALLPEITTTVDCAARAIAGSLLTQVAITLLEVVRAGVDLLPLRRLVRRAC